MKKKVLYFIALIFLGVGVLGINMYLETKEVVNIAPAIACLLIGFYIFRKARNKKDNEKEETSVVKRDKKLKKENKLKQKEEIQNTIYNASHQAGLPLAEGSMCSVKYTEDRFVISGGGSEFNLSYDKITDVTVKTDIEIQKAYVSSIGGAIGGAVVFGPLGAMIGGRAKEKKSTSRYYYLIITYLKDDKIEYISFDVTANIIGAQNVVKKFKDNGIKATHTVDL